MEDKLLYHYRAPRGEDLERALAELDGARDIEIAAAGSAGLATTAGGHREEPARSAGKHAATSDEAIPMPDAGNAE
jgi:hypothetical protein